MKKITIKVLVAISLLSTAMCTNVSDKNKEKDTLKLESEEKVKPQHSFKGNYDWEQHMVIADTRRDEAGRLLPLQSYNEIIRRGMSFLSEDHLLWFKGPGENLIDENWKTQMPWVYYSNVQHNGEPFPKSIDHFTSYRHFIIHR